VLSDRNVTLAEVLQSHGYLTAAEVAAPVLRSETRIAQGFDHYRGAESPGVTLKVVRYTQGATREETLRTRVSQDVTSRGIEFLRRARAEPFFLWLHYFDAHNPYSAPAAFNEKIPESPYHAEVASLDFQIGLLMSELEQLGLRGRTLVVLTADHGEGLGEHGEPSHSFLLYDTTMRVPLVLWGLDGLPVGKRVASPVRTLDILPTVLDLLGLEAPTDIQGVSLEPLLSGAASDLELRGYGEATRFAATFGLPVLRSLRDGRWKYIHKVNPELYDVIADPSERNNLAEQHPETLARLRAELRRGIENAPAAPSDARAAVDAETAAQLMALGYVAKSPGLAVADDVASLELSGVDPMAKVGDIARIAEANGLLRRKEFGEALRTLIPLRDANPDSSYVLGLVATAFRGLDRDDEAVSVLRRIRMLEPSDAEAAFKLAVMLGGPSDSSESQESQEAAEAVEILSELLRRSPCDERFQLEQSRRLRQLARHAELVELLAQGAEVCPDMLANLNNYAWALATLPDTELRDGAKAVQIMREVLAHAGESDLAYQDTLAAALAEKGEFEGAIRNGTAVLRRVQAEDGSEPVVDALRRHLAAYRSGNAIRDPEPSPAAGP
jgi:hypothetical protein